MTASRPVVDLTSAEVDTNFKASTIAALPLERSVRGAVPTDSRRRRQPQLDRTDRPAAAPGQHVPARRRQHHQSRLRVPEHRRQRARHSGGQRQAGGCVGGIRPVGRRRDQRRDAVGHQDLRGIARLDWLPERPRSASSPSTAFRDLQRRTEHYARHRRRRSHPQGQGVLLRVGPLREDDAGGRENQQVQRSAAGQHPEGPRAEREDHRASGTRQLVNVGFRDRPSTTTNSGLGSGTSADVGTDNESGATIGTASWAFFPANRTTVEVKYLYLKERERLGPADGPRVSCRPGTPGPDRVGRRGRWGTSPIRTRRTWWSAAPSTRTPTRYRRHEVRGTFTQFFDLGKSTPRAEGRRRVRVRRGVPDPALERAGGAVSVFDGSATSGRGTTSSSRRSSGRAAPVGLRPGQHHRSPRRLTVNAGMPVQPGRVRAGSRGQRRRARGRDRVIKRRGRPSTSRTATAARSCGSAFGERAPAAPRRQLQRPRGTGRQGVRQLGPLLRDGPEVERPQPRAAPRSTSTRPSSTIAGNS